jgi:hypothetical protein
VLSRNLHTLGSRDLYTQETFMCQKPNFSKTFSLEKPKSFEKLEET